MVYGFVGSLLKKEKKSPYLLIYIFLLEYKLNVQI